jgi:hypothetical protein
VAKSLGKTRCSELGGLYGEPFGGTGAFAAALNLADGHASRQPLDRPTLGARAGPQWPTS